MAPEPDHLLLRRYVAAREHGRAHEATELWERLAVNNFDRIAQLCKAFRFTGGTGLPPQEVGSAASEAYLRVIAMGTGFREHELGQYRAAVYRTVHNACLDYGRRELRHQRRSAGSIDATYEPDHEAGPFDAAIAAHAAERRAQEREALEDEARRQEAEGLVRWAIAQVANDGYRAVLELTFIEKLDGDQIAERLGITTPNVYQRRRRGLKELERILRARRP
jgi:RNA polymerase sigma factor (sigma-70 family)